MHEISKVEYSSQYSYKLDKTNFYLGFIFPACVH